MTDHKPLLGLFRENKAIPVLASARVQRWALLLSSYNYTLIYKPGSKHNNADALSRLPSPEDKPSVIPEPQEVVFSFRCLEQDPISSQMIARETKHDPWLSKVMEHVLKGWPPKLSDPELNPYFTRRNELSAQGDCLLWGSRVIVPPKFRTSVLEELHGNHCGIVRMKALGRSYVWWPNMDKDIEAKVKGCANCQEHVNNPPVAPLNPWSYPVAPWSRVHVDYMGPFESKMILVIVDSTSKFIDAHVLSGSSATLTIDSLRHTFANHGLPKEIVSDNAPCFVSQDFKTFCELNGICHIRVSPYRPASNGQAERGVQTIKNGLKKLADGTLEARLVRFLLTHSVLASFIKDANFYCHFFIQRVIIFKIILCDIIIIN